jgi:hypothetical protein
MQEWLIADLSVSDVHFQLWMLLVTGILLFGFCTLGHAVDSGGSCVQVLPGIIPLRALTSRKVPSRTVVQQQNA